jgi:hypothetical protein
LYNTVFNHLLYLPAYKNKTTHKKSFYYFLIKKNTLSSFTHHSLPIYSSIVLILLGPQGVSPGNPLTVIQCWL